MFPHVSITLRNYSLLWNPITSVELLPLLWIDCFSQCNKTVWFLDFSSESFRAPRRALISLPCNLGFAAPFFPRQINFENDCPSSFFPPKWIFPIKFSSWEFQQSCDKWGITGFAALIFFLKMPRLGNASNWALRQKPGRPLVFWVEANHYECDLVQYTLVRSM